MLIVTGPRLTGSQCFTPGSGRNCASHKARRLTRSSKTLWLPLSYPEGITSEGGAGGMDLDLRKLRCSAAVAEERNSARAAARLHIAQPVLSRQIRALEQDVKARLFERDTRGT